MLCRLAGGQFPGSGLGNALRDPIGGALCVNLDPETAVLPD
jgi:hypothetical protein